MDEVRGLGQKKSKFKTYLGFFLTLIKCSFFMNVTPCGSFLLIYNIVLNSSILLCSRLQHFIHAWNWKQLRQLLYRFHFLVVLLLLLFVCLFVCLFRINLILAKFEEKQHIFPKGLALCKRNITFKNDIFCRKNIAYVDIYYGDLEVESIIEQKEYEGFQFICKHTILNKSFQTAALKTQISILTSFRGK